MRTAKRSSGATLLLIAVSGACSGAGAGADSCRTIEHARCDRQAECDDWSDEERDQCHLDRDAACRAGGSERVRAAANAEVSACADAFREADCEALAEPFSLPGCEPFVADAGPS